MKLSRSRPSSPLVICLLVLTLLLGGSSLIAPSRSADPGPSDTTTPADDASERGALSLRQLAARRGLLIGTAVYNPPLLGDRAYQRLIAREFSTVTHGNVMKWDTVEPEHGLMDFTAAEPLMQAAARNNQVVRGHNLVWHGQLPSWIGRTWTNEQLAQFLEDHVRTQVAHFRGRIYAWDVVNEPIDEDGSLRETIWYRALGPDYIAQVLQWAHEEDPNARLYINDYNLESNPAKADGMYELVRDLLDRGIPIHGVGFQGHLGVQYDYPERFAEQLQRFADLGLEVAITEADVRMPLPVTEEQLERQAEYFGRMVSACLAVARCVSFTLWGVSDAHSWVPGFFPGEGAATPLDENLRPKPAWYAIRDALLTRAPGAPR